MDIILGIDPGSRITGYGIIQIQNTKPCFIDCGTIRVGDRETQAHRLNGIFEGIETLIARHNPTVMAIEQVFMHENPNSALKLGQARGAAMVAGAQAGLTVAEYSARQAKQAVVGYGAADKNQVQQMVTSIFNLSEVPTADAADALAIALCHVHTSQGLAGLTRRRGRGKRRAS